MTNRKNFELSHNRLVAVTGVTGAGKDFLVDHANPSKAIQTLNWGSLLGIELQHDRDQMMSAVPHEIIRATQFLVCGKILNMQPAIVTCHAIRPNPVSKHLEYDLETEKMFDPATYVFVEAPPGVIQQRVIERNLRGERQSNVQTVEEIAREQERKLELVTELTVELGTNLLVMSNTQDNLQDNLLALSPRFAEIAV